MQGSIVTINVMILSKMIFPVIAMHFHEITSTHNTCYSFIKFDLVIEKLQDLRSKNNKV
jgi:hypothetical protein